MPQVHTRKKNKRGTYPCVRCPEPIAAGQEYHEWAFRYGPTQRQHATHGLPKPSQLTQSKLSAVYAAVEDAEATIAGADEFEDIAAALESVAEVARDVAEEYREAVSAMNMEGAGTENEERADSLDEYADALENAAEEVRDKEGHVDERADEKIEEADEEADEDELREEAKDEALDEAREVATEALNDQNF